MASDDGGGARQVSSDGFDAENPTVTPDGQWIVYASAHAEKRGIWKVRPDGGEATRIASGQFTIPEVSPDGRFVAFLGDDLNGRREILVHRVGDGQPVPFTISVERRGTLDNNYGRLRWMPDGKALAFLAVDGDGAAGVFVQDFAEGVDTASTRRRLAGFDRDAVTESFGISPDGSTVVISGAVFSADVLVADGVTSVVKR
jgi:Tol biopolymer transport system component